jgi:cytochrome c-type biogenesis protein CcmH
MRRSRRHRPVLASHTDAKAGRRATTILLALVATFALAGPAAAQENDSSPGITPTPPGAEPQANLADLEDEVMCPICGTALGLSEAPQADRQREFIRDLIAQGKTEDEIKAELVAEYGDEVLAVPESEGFDLAAWLVPGAAILLAAIAILVGLRRWRRSDRVPDAPPPASKNDTERLDSDRARYDL